MEQKNTHLFIRDAKASDEEAIRTVILAAYEQYATLMPPLFWARYQQVILDALAEKGPVERIVAEYAGKIVGSVYLYPPTTSAYRLDSVTEAMGSEAIAPEVRLLAVDPALQRHGVGKALMLECIRRAQNSGYSALGLHTMDTMQTAMQMYERMGFVHVPELDFHPTEPIVVKGYRLELEKKHIL